jgi:hypothetical protein
MSIHYSAKMMNSAPDRYSAEVMDPDPESMNPDPQHCFLDCSYWNIFYFFSSFSISVLLSFSYMFRF